LPRRWRGYDRAGVEILLGRVHADYTGGIDRIAGLAQDRASARTEHQGLQSQLGQLTDTARTAADRTRADADTAAAAIRARAEQAAALILSQAEQGADAQTRRAQALHAAAQADADTARTRLEHADQRARQLEDAARYRWEALRSETEARFEQLQIAERRFAQRIAHIETSLGALRSQVGLLDQVQQIEQALAAVRTDTRPVAPPQAPNAEHSNGHPH